MRKISTLMLTGVLALSLCACGDTTTTPVDTDVNQVSPDTTISKPINPDVSGKVESGELVENKTEDGFSGTSGTIGDASGNTPINDGIGTGSGGFGGTESGLTIVNPWTECDTIEEAEALVGFNFDSIKSAEINTISAMVSDDMNIIQATFFDGDNEITIRKSNALGDASGDFRVYENVVTEERDGVNITYSGNGETFGLVIWEKDNYSYSISCDTEISKDIMDTFVNVVFEDSVVAEDAQNVAVVNQPELKGDNTIAEYSIPVMVRVIGAED